MYKTIVTSLLVGACLSLALAQSAIAQGDEKAEKTPVVRKKVEKKKVEKKKVEKKKAKQKKPNKKETDKWKPDKKNAKKPIDRFQVDKFDRTGTVAVVDANARIYMNTDDGERWQVQIHTGQLFSRGQTIVDIRGTMNKKALKVGRNIRFSALLDQKGLAKGLIKEVSLFTTGGVYKPALLPDDAGALDNLGDEKKPAKQPRFRRFLVAGPIQSMRGNRVVVITPKGPVGAKLAANVVVKFQGDRYELAKPGDRIHVEGGSSKKGVVIARKISIRRGDPPVKPAAGNKIAKAPANDPPPKVEKKTVPLILIVN